MATDSVGACCCGAVLPSISLHQPVLDLALSSGTLAPVTSLLGQTIAPLRTCADRTYHVQRRVRSLLANVPFAGPCGRSCAPPSPVRRRLLRATPFLLDVVSSCFCRRRRSSATASGTLLSRRPCHECVLPTSLGHLAVGVSRVRHRLSVTFEMLGLCCCSDDMSSSSWTLSFAPSSQQLLVHELSL